LPTPLSLGEPRPSAGYEWNGCGTAWGKHVYATGDDVEAAPLACIRTDRVLLSVYDLRTGCADSRAPSWPTRAHGRGGYPTAHASHIAAP
jgi:hypothetical protein